MAGIISNCISLIILRPGKGKTFPNKNNRADFSGEKQYNEAFQSEPFFEKTQKSFKLNLVLVVVLVLKSEAL